MFSATSCRATARSIHAMASAPTVAPFSKAVVNAMRKLYPEKLADSSWDNTGLLLEAPFDPLRRQMNSVLLAVDLTKAVVDEAIERKDSIIVAYHPIIFRGLKSITLGNSQQQSLLRLAAEGISVYSPHTAVDCAKGGLGDWLADIVTGSLSTEQAAEAAASIEQPSKAEPAGSKQEILKSGQAYDENNDDPFVLSKRPTYRLQHHPSGADIKDVQQIDDLAELPHQREPIKPVIHPDHPGAGMGRIVRFEESQSLTSIIDRIARGVGNPKGIPIAIPQNRTVESINIRSVGICAGSGGSLFSGLDVDLLFTGELSHHETLAAIENGQVVITLFHSNSERGFLHNVLKSQLSAAIREEWVKVKKEERAKENVSPDVLEALEDDYVIVEVSEVDRDPYGILIAETAD